MLPKNVRVDPNERIFVLDGTDLCENSPLIYYKRFVMNREDYENLILKKRINNLRCEAMSYLEFCERVPDDIRSKIYVANDK